MRPWCEMSLKLAGPQLFGEGRRVLAESMEVRGTGGVEGPCVGALRRRVHRAGKGPRLAGAWIMSERVSRG